ncbi:MAG: hypothetical protein GX591_16355 [Planctomycetes bacterium]|nr:hypothetical protein [Planctomycetota bacterium]
MKANRELRCCKGCGRDTRSDYCPRCIGHGGAGLRRAQAARAAELPLEDDYGEESDANSVCQDDSGSVPRV